MRVCLKSNTFCLVNFSDCYKIYIAMYPHVIGAGFLLLFSVLFILLSYEAFFSSHYCGVPTCPVSCFGLPRSYGITMWQLLAALCVFRAYCEFVIYMW